MNRATSILNIEYKRIIRKKKIINWSSFMLLIFIQSIYNLTYLFMYIFLQLIYGYYVISNQFYIHLNIDAWSTVHPPPLGITWVLLPQPLWRMLSDTPLMYRTARIFLPSLLLS